MSNIDKFASHAERMAASSLRRF